MKHVLKLLAIKRLFQLCTSVKIQFYKTFILPYFDNCCSLQVFVPKLTIQIKLYDCNYSCPKSYSNSNFDMAIYMILIIIYTDI